MINYGELYLIPARRDSVRLKEKNWRPFGSYGMGLIEKAVKTCKESAHLTYSDRGNRLATVVVSTDIEKLKGYAETWGFRYHERPKDLRGERVPTEDVVADVLENYKEPCYPVVLVQCTSPGLTAQMLQKALSWSLMNSRGIVSINRTSARPNGAFHIFDREYFEKHGDFFPPEMGVYLMGSRESIDIDTIEDFRIAEAIETGKVVE